MLFFFIFTLISPLSSFAVAPGLKAGTFQQAIDHFGENSGRFSQRYWTFSEYAQGSDAPVLFRICGEGDGEFFQNDSTREWARALGARVVYLEHRYYGESLPFSDLSTEHLTHLTLDNTIEDLAQFQKFLMAQEGWTGRWISVGGSYSGTLSALYRLKHPELVVGALASSAPIFAAPGEPHGAPADVKYLSAILPYQTSNERQWAYQACRELPFWHNGGRNVYDTSEWLCENTFLGMVPTNTHTYLENYANAFTDQDGPSNILFTYGTRDLWTSIGIDPLTNANSKITVHFIANAEHHEELNKASPKDSSEIQKARALFLEMARSWLVK